MTKAIDRNVVSSGRFIEKTVDLNPLPAPIVIVPIYGSCACRVKRSNVVIGPK
jgi:hypothetical protein